MAKQSIPIRRIRWRPSYRIVASRFPPVGLFDRIADPADLEAIYEIEGLTNPRIRQEMGALSLVPAERRVSGPGTTPIMAAFTHLSPDGSRFSTGTFGVYYAARSRQTAIKETVYHRELFLRQTQEPPCAPQFRCYHADISAAFHDIRGGYPKLHAPNSYAASQQTALRLREEGSNGIVFDSVRDQGGQCVAVFFPDLIAPTTQGVHLTYHYDGQRIAAVSIVDQIIHLS